MMVKGVSERKLECFLSEAAAGIASVGVAWGFRFAEELFEAGAQRVVTTIDELREVVL